MYKSGVISKKVQWLKLFQDIYLENTLENTLWLESPVLGADSEFSCDLFSPVSPSTQASGYERRFNICRVKNVLKKSSLAWN